MLRFWVLAGALSAGAVAAGAETVVLEAVERGTFRENGSWMFGAEAEYSVGREAAGEARGVLVFDVSGFEGGVEAATLGIWNPADGFSSPDRREHVVVYGVSAAADELTWEPAGLPAWTPFEPSLGTFWDLGTGRALGSARVEAAAGFVEVPLDASFLRVVARSPGRVALGLRASSLRSGAAEERVFAGSGAGVPRPQLVLVPRDLPERSSARTLRVDPKARRRDARSEPPRFRTLAEALDLATPGDLVLVAPGHYPETLVMKDGVDVVGAGADRTMLDLGTALPSARCADGGLSGLSIWQPVGSPASLGPPALDCTNGSSPRLSANAIASPNGAIRLAGSRAELVGNQLRGSIDAVDSAPSLRENEIEGFLYAVTLARTASGDDEPLVIERNRLTGMLWLLCAATPESRIVGNLLLPVAPVPSGLALDGGLTVHGDGDLGLIASNTFFRTAGIALGGRSVPFGSPVCQTGTRSATLANNLVVFGSAGISLAEHSTATLLHNDVFGNQGVTFPSEDSDYVGLADPTGLDGNLSEDPLFAGFAFEAPDLAAGSPALDAGANEFAATSADLDGGARIVDATGLGEARIDIGAAEREPGEGTERRVELSVETERIAPFGSVLVLGRPFWVALRSDDELDAPAEVDPASLTLEGSAPLGGRRQRCRVRDVDGDGDADLRCRFPFEALDALPRLPTKRVCIAGRTLDGSPLRGCRRIHVRFVSRDRVR